MNLKEYQREYYSAIEADLQFLKDAGINLSSLTMVTGTPSPELQAKALRYYSMPTSGGFLLDQRWLMLKEDLPEAENETNS